MSDPIYGRWFDAKEVPVTNDAYAWIVIANRSAGEYPHVAALSARSYLGALARREPPADFWMRIPPPPWLE